MATKDDSNLSLFFNGARVIIVLSSVFQDTGWVEWKIKVNFFFFLFYSFIFLNFVNSAKSVKSEFFFFVLFVYIS